MNLETLTEMSFIKITGDFYMQVFFHLSIFSPGH